MTKPAAFKQSDVTRLLRAAKDADVQVAKIELEPTGKIVLFMGDGKAPATANPWDQELQ